MSGRFGDVMDHFHDPQNRGRLDNPDVTGQAGSASAYGVVTVTIRLQNDIVMDARHESHGCGFTIACGSMLTEWAKSRSAAECLALEPQAFADEIDGLPVYKRHCPLLVVAALQSALEPSARR